MQFGTKTYRAGALERIGDAAVLLENGHLAGAVYYAGFAVECMLRSLVWLKDKQLDERHDLRRLAVRIESLGLLRRGENDEGYVGMIQGIAARWHNNMRFAASDQLARRWLKAGILRRKNAGSLRAESRRFVDECVEAVGRCEVLWQRQQRSSLKES